MSLMLSFECDIREVKIMPNFFCRKIHADPPSKEVCSCAIDDDGNRLIEHLKYISNYLRHFDNKTAIREYQKEFFGENEIDNHEEDTIIEDRRCWGFDFYINWYFCMPRPHRPNKKV